MSIRDALRAEIFSAKNKTPRTKVISLFGQEVEVRQPTLGQIDRLSKRSDKQSAIVAIMIEYCYVPGTNEKVFDPADQDSILSLPTGQWLTDFNKAIEELSGVNVEEAEKNSEETA